MVFLRGVRAGTAALVGENEQHIAGTHNLAILDQDFLDDAGLRGQDADDAGRGQQHALALGFAGGAE